MENDYDVIVIGAGPAGVTSALRASELGARVCLIERASPGGTCTNDGCVPTRSLARAARLVREARQFQTYGLLGEVPEVDFPGVLARAQQIVYTLHEKKQIVGHLISSGVEVVTSAGQATFVDPFTVILENGARLSAQKFILCPGGRSRKLDFPGAEYTLDHSDVWRLKALPKTVTIFGGAATGCQLASIFDDFGVNVRIAQLGNVILEREDPSIAAMMTDLFRERGIELMLGLTKIGSVTPIDGSFSVQSDFTDGPRQWETGAVITAVGWVGNVEGLGLKNAGVEVERGYIKVDDYQQTSRPHIFAAGDVTGRMMLVQSAVYEGRIAAENAVLGRGLPYRHLIVPHGGFTDPEYAGVGMTEAQAAAQNLDIVVATVPFKDADRAVIDGHTDGFCKVIVNRDNHRIIGAAVVGEQAVEIIQLFAAAMAADMWVEQLAELELAYPTYTAIIGLAARRAIYDLGVIPVTAEWRAHGRPPAAEWERSSGPFS